MPEQFSDRSRTPLPFSSGGSAERTLLLSVVVPCMDEEEVLRETNRRLVAVLQQAPVSFEVVYVDDGSTDSTPDLLRALQAQDARVRVVRFSRNFGQQIAITAGLEHASGDARDQARADPQSANGEAPRHRGAAATPCQSRRLTRLTGVTGAT